MRARLASLAACCLLLGACSVLPKAEAPTVYRLPAAPANDPDTTAAALPWALRIDTPLAGGGLDSARIAVLPGPDEITSYKGARWSDRAPVLLRDRLFDAFLASGRVPRLSVDDGNLQADLELGGSLRAFQSEYQDGRPVVVIRYDAQLIRSGAQRILAARRFDVRVPAAGKEVPQVVAAFGAASDQLAAAVIPWTLQAAAQAPARSSERSD
ncbi:ABC-type transport auxiliary lipoprotein family protein [Frateuria defendens]|uniref:ABC-type transport auxiliary lipoprotein family protein n=1 Tax=Frateuria defendens TaxID=2219559 RepID=UPI00066FE183|nr:ABC-type transport auxiliary lipoprotein family protein [Frateuria defendens]